MPVCALGKYFLLLVLQYYIEFIRSPAFSPMPGGAFRTVAPPPQNTRARARPVRPVFLLADAFVSTHGVCQTGESSKKANKRIKRVYTQYTHRKAIKYIVMVMVGEIENT